MSHPQKRNIKLHTRKTSPSIRFQILFYIMTSRGKYIITAELRIGPAIFTPPIRSSPVPIKSMSTLARLGNPSKKLFFPRGEPQPNVVYTYFHFHFKEEDNR